MDNQNKMNCIMTLSGFGPFGSVTENPTMRLIKSITEDERKVFNILVCEVVETSTIGVKAHLEELTKLKQTYNNQYKHLLNIHLGVYAGSREFNLEQCGYNLKEFSIPDVRGCQDRDQPIAELLPKNCPLQTKIDLFQVRCILGKKGYKFVNISADPGRYICNYIYFSSLFEMKDCDQVTSLFIHVPLFDQISFETQRCFLIDLIQVLTDLTCKDCCFVKQEEK